MISLHSDYCILTKQLKRVLKGQIGDFTMIWFEQLGQFEVKLGKIKMLIHKPRLKIVYS